MKIPARLMILAAVVALGPFPRAAADPLQDCAEQAADAAEYSACLARRQRQSIRRLHEARDAATNLARERGAEAELSAAEAAFDAYVEAACAARARLGSRDVDPGDLRRDCVIRLLENRADDLEAMTSELDAP